MIEAENKERLDNLVFKQTVVRMAMNLVGELAKDIGVDGNTLNRWFAYYHSSLEQPANEVLEDE